MPTIEDAIAVVKSYAESAQYQSQRTAYPEVKKQAAALTHALALLEGLRWRPIETAPKNGMPVEMEGVREYAEGLPVELLRDKETGRPLIRAFNEAGHNCTEIDLLDLLAWLGRSPTPPPPETRP